jgi:hypothetical protein
VPKKIYLLSSLAIITSLTRVRGWSVVDGKMSFKDVFWNIIIITQSICRYSV